MPHQTFADLQLQLGYTPLKKVKVGSKVGFVLRIRKKKVMHIGIIKNHDAKGVTIEGLTVPGLYRRARKKLFDVQKDMQLSTFA